MSDMIPHCYVCHNHHYGEDCPEALRVLLDLPDDTEIHDAIGGHDTVSLLVSSPDIHPTAMRVRAVYCAAFGGSNFSRWQIVAKRNPSRGGIEDTTE